MKNIYLFLLTVLFGATGSASFLKVFCKAQELVLPTGCHPIRSSQIFEAFFDADREIAMASAVAELNPNIEFRIMADPKMKILTATISEIGVSDSRSVNASRKYNQAEDYVYVVSSHFKKSLPGDCNNESFEMLCMLVDTNLTTELAQQKLSKKLLPENR